MHRPIASESVGRTGIESQVRGGETHAVSITGNRFIDMGTSIRLAKIYGEETDPATFDFTLKCNQFRLDCAEENVLLSAPDPCDDSGVPERKGLVIGEGVQVNSPGGGGPGTSQIGGTSTFNTSNNQYPNANQWPVRAGIDRATLPPGSTNIQNLPWRKPSNWVSIENATSNPLVRYHRYKNEFVHNDIEEDVWNLKTPFVDLSVKMTASTGTNAGEKACLGFDIDDFDVFPLRVAVVPDSTNLYTGAKSIELSQPWVGEPYPNPSASEAKIKAFIPPNEPFAVFQMVDLGTGKILSGKVIEERGNLNLFIDCSKAASGTYGYQILLGKKRLGMKKLVILK